MTSVWKGKITLPIDNKRFSYQYKFVINNSDWVINEDLPTARDSNGFVNNNLKVPRGDS